MKLQKLALLLASSGAIALGAGAASANITFTDSTGQYTVGIGPDGELFDSSTYVGLLNPAGSDYIAPGDPRDSWGVTSSAGSAFADYAYYGTSGVFGSTLTPGANSALITSTTAAGLTVSQNFAFLSPNIVSIQETLTNTSGSDLTGVIFRRDVDYDVSPTEFNENTVGPFGANANVIGNSFYGFENPNPASGPFFDQCGAFCNQQGDLGAGIDFGVGTIAAGGSATFAFFYGINQPSQTLSQLFAQAQTEGLSYTLGTQSSENGDYPNQGAGAAILGVSDVGTIAHMPGVPEPASWALMLTGFGLIGGAMRRRQRTAALAV
jgi:hypothetical protein